MRGNANSLEQVVNHERELVGLCLILGKRPRLGVFDVVVRSMDKLHNGIFACTVIEHVHRGGIAIDQTLDDFSERVVKRIGAGRLCGSAAVKVLRAHVQRAGNQVAPAVSQIGVVHLLHALKRNSAIGAGNHVGHEVVAVAFNTQQVDNVLRGNGVAAALRHFFGLAGLGVAHRKEAVREHVLGQRLANSHEHGRPNDAVEADDVLAHNVVLSGPTEGKLCFGSIVVETITHSRHVVQQRVEPHIGHMAVIERHGNAPIEARTAHGKVVQTAFDEAAHLIHAEIGLHEFGMLVVEREQLVLERGKLEEVRLFLHALERTMAVGAQVLANRTVLLVALLHLVVGVIGLVGHAVPTIVAALVQVARFLHALPEVLNRMVLARLGRANEVVIGNLERLPQILEQGSLAVAPRLRRIEAVLLGGLGDLFAMLVHAGEEFDVVAHRATVASLDIGQDGRVRGSQMGRRVYVINGRGNKE